jgi:hypothetical protein
MDTVIALVRATLTTVNSDILALLLPAFVALVGILIAGRILGRPLRDTLLRTLQACSRSRYFPAVLGVAAFGLTVYVGRLAIVERIDLEADMSVSAGEIVEVRANDPNLPALRAAIAPNERRIYRFEGIPSRLTYLRIDPTEASSAHITIYAIRIVSAGRELRWFGPGDLRSWRMIHLNASKGPALCLVSTTDDPILDTNLSFSASNSPAWVDSVVDVFRRPHLYTLELMVFFLVFVAAGMTTDRGTVEAALVALVVLLSHTLVLAVRAIPFSPPSVSSSIGYANFVGYPKFQDSIASLPLLLMCAAIAWCAARFVPLAKTAPRPLQPTPEGGRSVWTAHVTGIAVAAVLVVYYLPNLGRALEELQRASYHPVDWDSQNSLLWTFLVSHGYLPFRDFWYPYAGFFSHRLQFPAGNLIAAVEYILTLWFLYTALRMIFQRFRPAAIVLFGLMLIAVIGDEFVGWFRYLLGVDVGLFYVALQALPPAQRRRAQFVFAALVAFAFWYEPVQLIYASAGILVHAALAAWPKQGTALNWQMVRGQVLPALRQRLIPVAGPALIGITPVLLFLAVTRMLPGFIAFHLGLSDQSVYGALPADVGGWTIPTLRFETVYMLLFLTMVLALYGWFRDRLQPDPATVAMLVVCFAGLMTMQKQLVRPHNMQVVQVYPFLAALLYGVRTWQRKTRAQLLVVAVFLGSVAGFAQNSGLPKRLYVSAMVAPGQLAGDLDVLWNRRLETRIAGASACAPSRFSSFLPENSVMQTLRTEYGWTSADKLYVLGDDSIFYILAGQEAPYVANNYNCSPLTEQKHVLAWLQSRRPRFVVWNPAHGAFDTVPHVVRLPLIYQYVVENYRPSKVVGPYHILVSGPPLGEVDARYWAKELGSAIDLGHIPQLARASEYRECPATSQLLCGPVWFVHLPVGNILSGKATATLHSAAGPIQILFDIVPGSGDYVVDLDRLWFRKFLDPGPEPVLSTPGAEFRYERRLRKDGILY